jgi:transcriptional regulator GlxA family with amidase domain
MLTLLALVLFPSLSRATAPAQDSRPRNVAILVYEGVELLDFAGPGEVFSAAHGPSGRGFRPYTVAKSRAPVTSQGFVTLTPQHTLADCPAPDIVVVPGGNVPDEDRELVEWLRRAAGSAELVMTVCNGAFLAAEAGLLAGGEATTHHGSLEGLTARYPDVRVLTNRRFVDRGRVLTSAGVSAGIDGALHVVTRLLGEESARNAARYMEYDWRPEAIAAQHAEPGRTVGEGVGAELAARVKAVGLERALAEYRADPERPGEAELGPQASMLLRTGKLAEARALLELLTAVYPDSPRAHERLSEACERLGDRSEAVLAAEAALTRLKTAKDLPAERARMLENAAASRLVRLGQGDPESLRFHCNCGGPCDAERYVSPGPCPGCGMEMVSAAAGG